ncbi:MAG: competence/damage-inducible protein A [Oligoflexales bacterium]|nr:competence/damage-inducible protein A [Oligoflexales bacterium]
MNAEVIAVGTELLMGQIANTNAQYISKKIQETGINVFHHSVVGDNRKRLHDLLAAAFQRSDLVILTGGLGPTQDDLTKESVAEYFGLKLVLHEDILQRIIAFFEKIGRRMTENNAKQAYFPEGCIVLGNEFGTAPGCIVENSGKTAVLLPGPPREMCPIFDNSVIPFLKNKSDHKFVSKYLKIFGIGESALETELIDLIKNQTNPTIATYAGNYEVTLRVTARAASEEEAEALIKPVIEQIDNKIGRFIYSKENKSIEETIAHLLIRNNITLSIAESCTGGLIASKLTNVPGISAVFDRAIVSYSNRSKIENLNVRQETIEKHGAVSEETAIEMASGILSISGTSIGLSITGIAGPEGGSMEKPVGLVYIAVTDGEKCECKKLTLSGDRDRIRNLSTMQAFYMLWKFIRSRFVSPEADRE